MWLVMTMIPASLWLLVPAPAAVGRSALWCEPCYVRLGIMDGNGRVVRCNGAAQGVGIVTWAISVTR